MKLRIRSILYFINYEMNYKYLKLFCLHDFNSIYRKLWSSGRALGSRSEGCGFDPHPMLDGSGVKAMPGSISAPNSDSL